MPAAGGRDPSEHVFSVRGRPVGFRSARFGGELFAVERGYFPVSSSGYYSLSGMTGGQSFGAEDVSPEYLEALAVKQDRERRELVGQLRQALRPEPEPLRTFIRANMAADRAVNDGFFAPPGERETLWQGAHRVLALIDTDRRFQPAPDGGIWSPPNCERSMNEARHLLQFLRACAGGEFPHKVPLSCCAARAYRKLPAKADHELVVMLDTVTAELAMELPDTVERYPARRARLPSSVAPEPLRNAGEQLGLFDTAPGQSASASGPQLAP